MLVLLERDWREREEGGEGSKPTLQTKLFSHQCGVILNQWGLTTHPSRKSNLDYIYNQMVRWTPPSRPNNVCKMSVRPSVHKKFLRFQWNLVCRNRRGRWAMHDGMQYDSIQGQGHDPLELEFRNSAIFKRYLLPQSLSGPDFWFLT